MSTSLIGKKLGKYTVTSTLGQGGMATVYVGHQDDIDRDVAIKVLAPHPGQDARFVARFRQEARTIARLQHPHILPVYDYGDENDVLYLVMAYIRGGTLSDRLRRGALGISETERLVREIGGALDYAHRQQVVHRDVKPANILLDKEGHALLTDFGIARLIEDSSSGLTGTGNLVGTPAYMSPEQAQSIEVDHRADLYALAIVAFEMLTGKQPFQGDTAMQTVLRQISAPPPLHLLPSAFIPVIGRALAKDPSERYQSVADFVADFTRAMRGEPLAPYDTGVTLQSDDRTVTAPTGAYTAPTGSGVYPTPTPTGASYSGYATSGGAQPTPTGNTTIIQQQSINPLVLLGGFAIIAVLLVAVVLLVLRPPGDLQDGPPGQQTPVPPTVVAVEAIVAPTSGPVVPIFGRVSFGSSDALGDTVSVRVDDLAPAGTGNSYTAWLISGSTDEVLPLGAITLDPLGAGAITYTDPDGRTLLANFNQIIITREAAVGDAPTGEVVYRGGVPDAVAPALIEILQSSPDGLPPRGGSGANMSLIASALSEAQIASQHAGLAARATSVGSMKTHAEHTINILRGQEAQEDLDGNGRIENPGRGFGVRYFLDRIDIQLATIVEAENATPQMQSQVELIRVCILNTATWVDNILVREAALIASDSLEAVQTEMVESTEFATRMINGDDLNGNGQVDPFEGECGLSQIVEYGIAVGNYPIVQAEVQ